MPNLIDDTIPKIPVGISSCLLGERVRFDGGHKNHSYISQTLSDYFNLQPFCPEVAIGLGTPRETIRLVRFEKDGPVHCVGSKNPDLDVTEKLAESGRAKHEWLSGLCGYIFKKDSPSCGMTRVKIYYASMPDKTGVGIYANEVLKAFPNLPTEEEGRLGDTHLRENFIKRVFIYQRWREIEDSESRKDFVNFHAQHKLIFMSHNQDNMRKLGQLVASISTMDLSDFKQQYLDSMTAILRLPASRKNHVNVLKHIQGYLKRDIDIGDKEELNSSIEDYRQGLVPLIVPITLLKHHFRRNPDEYISQSLYMTPHPRELSLINGL